MAAKNVASLRKLFESGLQPSSEATQEASPIQDSARDNNNSGSLPRDDDSSRSRTGAAVVAQSLAAGVAASSARVGIPSTKAHRGRPELEPPSEEPRTSKTPIAKTTSPNKPKSAPPPHATSTPDPPESATGVPPTPNLALNPLSKTSFPSLLSDTCDAYLKTKNNSGAGNDVDDPARRALEQIRKRELARRNKMDDQDDQPIVPIGSSRGAGGTIPALGAQSSATSPIRATAVAIAAPQRGYDLLLSPNSNSTTSPPSAFSPAFAAPSPASALTSTPGAAEGDPSFETAAKAAADHNHDSSLPESAQSEKRNSSRTSNKSEHATAISTTNAPYSHSTDPVVQRLGAEVEAEDEDGKRSLPLSRIDATNSKSNSNPHPHPRLLPLPLPLPLPPNSTSASTPEPNLSPSLDSGEVNDSSSNPATVGPQLIRPKATRPQQLGQPRELKRLPLSRASSTRSVCSNAPLQHPTPELNARSGAYTGNIAALEATAERLSMTSSIEDAIRDANAQLKRSDSQRSVALVASLKKSNGPEGSGDPSPFPTISRQLSIVSLNNAARSGGYSPSGYIMSPSHSLSATRLRSGSKTSSTGVPASVHGDVIPEEYPSPVGELDGGGSGVGGGLQFMSRHGPGKTSVRSVMSNKLSLAEIAEVEPPMTLTQEALDEADRLTASGDERGDDDTIRPSALQLAHMDFDTSPGLDLDLDLTPNLDNWAPQSMHRQGQSINDYGFDSYESYDHMHHAQGGYLMPGQHPHRQQHFPSVNDDNDQDRPMTAASVATYDQARAAFGDFDGVHCDPDLPDFPSMTPPEPIEQPQPQPRPRPQSRLPMERPKSYFNQETGQQMLYYPARVPAMLNLPPKLSKKPKTAARNARQSRLLDAMAQEKTQSRVWLPDTLEGGFGTPLMDADEGSVSLSKEPRPPSAAHLANFAFEEPVEAYAAQGSASPTKTDFTPQELRRPAPLVDAEKRKSRMSMMPGVPPQLRASAFFDMPSASPRIELKGGSAMDTLDSILDASASAPVSAFTDHAFAGKLGSEVYGAEKKKKKKEKSLSVDNRNIASTVREVKARASFMSLVGHKRVGSEASAYRQSTMLSPNGDSSNQGGSASPHRSSVDGELPVLSPGMSEGGRMMAPDADEQESSSEEGEENEEIYQGPPTTLLAELQIRKQQQKLRTRPINQAHPNGLHTTLLELDAVAEVERRARKGKRVNLAWEDPALARDDSEDDEDVPLAMLQAIRGNPGADISAVAAEINRPLGLMERRDQEDNEPLSRRRDRLQGRDSSATAVYLSTVPATRNPNRASMLTLTPTMAALNRSGAISPGQQSQIRLVQAAPDLEGPQEEEIEDEPLGDRMRRLKAREADNPLPLARPVSGAFSVELLSQFGDLDDNNKDESNANGKSKNRGKPSGGAAAKDKENMAPSSSPPPEEEETLGQRRRRLQAEKEAREREMGVNGAALQALTGGVNGPGPGVNGNGVNGANGRLAKRLSMADVLAAHPRDSPMGSVDPRSAERLRREAEGARAQREMDGKMRLLRAQMPQEGALPRGVGVPTAMGIGATRSVSGYMGGRFNDGAGGGVGLPIGAARDGPGVGSWGRGHYQGGAALHHAQSTGNLGTLAGGGGGGSYGNGFAAGPVGGQAGVYSPAGMGATSPAYGVGAQLQMQGAQADRVERWRQSVMP